MLCLEWKQLSVEICFLQSTYEFLRTRFQRCQATCAQKLAMQAGSQVVLGLVYEEKTSVNVGLGEG